MIILFKFYIELNTTMIKHCQQQTINHLQNLHFLLTDLLVLKPKPSQERKQTTKTSIQQIQEKFSPPNLRQKLVISSKTSSPIIYYQMKELIFCEKLYIQHQINHKYLVQTYQDLTFTEIIISKLSSDIQDQEIREQVQYEFGRALKLYSMSIKLHSQKSINIYQSILAKEPQNLAILNNLALAYRKHNNLTKSKQILEKSIKIHPHSHQLYLNYASTLLLIDYSPSNLDFIIQTLQKSLQKNRVQFQSHHNLGCAYKYKKQYQKSVQSFTNSIKADPKDHISYYALASIYKQSDKNQLALLTILDCLKVKQGHHLALICLANILINLFITRQRVKLTQDLCNTLQLYTNQKDYFSLHQYKQLKSIYKIYDRCYKQGYQSIQLFNGLGNTCLLQKKYRKAITYFTKIIDQYNKHIFGYNGVALSYYYMKEFNQSLSRYQQALQRSQDQSLSIVIGYIFCILKSQTKQNTIKKLYPILEKLNNSHELVCYFKAYNLEGVYKTEMIKKGLSLSSNQNQSYKILADIMFQLEDYITARQYYTKYLCKDPFSNCNYFIGRCCQQQGDRIQAVNHYMKQLQSNPSDEHTLYRVAQMYYSLNFSNQNYHIIYSLIKKILQINPQSIKTIFLYSKLQMDQCHYDKRLMLLRSLYMLNEYSADACNSLALAYLYNNQQYQSFNYFTNGKKKDPKNALIFQNMACLQLLIDKKQTAFQYFIKSFACSDTNFAVYINCQEEINISQDYFQQKAIKIFYYSLRMIAREKNEVALRYYIKFLSKKQQIVKHQIKNYISTLDFMKYKDNTSSNFLQLFKYLLIRTFYNKTESQNAFNIFIKKSQANDYIFRLTRFKQSIIKEVIDQQLRKELYFMILQQLFQIDEYAAMKANQYFCSLSPSFSNNLNRIKLINTYSDQAINKINQLIHQLSSHIKQQQKQPSIIQTIHKSSYLLFNNIQFRSDFIILLKAQQFKQKLIALQQYITIQNLLATFQSTDHNNLQKIIYGTTHIQFKEYKQLQEEISELQTFITEIQKDYQRKLEQSIHNFNFVDLKQIFLQDYEEYFIKHFCIKFMYNCIYFYMEENDRKKLIQYFWDLFNCQRQMLKILTIIRQISNFIKQKSAISNSFGSKIFLSFDKQCQKSTQSQIDPSKISNKKTIITVILSQQQQTFFNNWSQQSQNSYNQRLIQKSCINPANDEPSYLRIKQMVEKQVGYFQIYLFFREINKQVHQYIQIYDQKPLFLQPINNDTIFLQQMHKQYQDFQKIMRKGKKDIFLFIYSLFQAVRQLHQYQIYHFDLSFRNFVKQQNKFKLIDFDHSIIYSQQNGSKLKEVIECWLKYPQQNRKNIIQYIFKYNAVEVIAKLMDLQQHLSKNALQNNTKMQLQKTVDIFRQSLRQYSIQTHVQQINYIISNIIESDNINKQSIFTPQHKSQIIKLLQSDFYKHQNSILLEKFKQFMSLQLQNTQINNSSDDLHLK